MFSLFSVFTLFLISIFVHPIHGATHPAKRQDPLTFQDICGADAPDCRNGYCCYKGQECIAASPEPLCRDPVIPDFTQPAVAYSSLQADFNLISSLIDPSNLLSLGVTITTPIPKTLPTTGRFTALTSYSDNIWPSYSTPTPTESAAAVSSTAAAARGTVGVGMLVGGVAGLGVFAGL